MCFYFRQTKKAQEVENRFKVNITNKDYFKPEQNIVGFSFPQAAVIPNNCFDSVQYYNWGLIPFWAENDEIRKYTLNAKIETLSQKPSFRNSVNNRCMVIADGFYEWQWLDSKGKNKQKFLLTLPDDGIFSLAGIWSEWVNKRTQETIKTFSIITTEANKLMSEIHNSKKRMPVILTQENEKYWLNGGEIDDFRIINTELTAAAI